MNARARRSFWGDESGLALVTVVIMSTILFLLVMSILVLVSFRTSQTTHYTARNQAMHLADAGINEYLYRLSTNSFSYYIDNPTLGPTTMEDGTWVVTAEKSGQMLHLRSTGTLNSGVSRTINAMVRFPGYADYARVVGDGDVTFGSTTIVEGKVRYAGNIYNNGVITGKAYACGTGKKCYNGSSSPATTAKYPGGWENGAVAPDFTKIVTDLTKIKTTAQAENSYFPGTGYKGYRVTFVGNNVRVEKVTAVNTTYPTAAGMPVMGALTVTATQTIAVPSSGVLYFDDYVWPAGTYSGPVTIASSQDVYFTQNILRSTANPKAVCGIVAQGDIWWPIWYAEMPNDLTIEAALLAQSGKYGKMSYYENGYGSPYSYTGDRYYYYTKPSTTTPKYYFDLPKNDVVLRGSLASAAGTNGFYSEGTPNHGFLGNRVYAYDPVLYDEPPPMFPQLPGDTLHVETWLED